MNPHPWWNPGQVPHRFHHSLIYTGCALTLPYLSFLLFSAFSWILVSDELKMNCVFFVLFTLSSSPETASQKRNLIILNSLTPVSHVVWWFGECPTDLDFYLWSPASNGWEVGLQADQLLNSWEEGIRFCSSGQRSNEKSPILTVKTSMYASISIVL